MADVKRWTVTYTKHIRQKRKVYQDGLLELHSSSNKVMLYDDCEKLLECRLLKKDEVVICGETLTFNAYLIDVGNPDGENKRISDLTMQGKDKRPNLFHGKRIGIHSDRKTNAEESKAHHTPSPSQKIIREFKKRELHKYGSPKSSPETTKHSSSEWQVLYTTHLTQKAKKYHDGFLQLAIQGSFGRQVILFDASRKFLDSRFLKKDEVVRTDESIAFDAYLVEIGEHEEDQKPNVNGQGNNCSTVARRGLKHEQKNYANTNVAVGNEWQVLYTTQLTQKAKKYHDGFLQLEVCGSRGRQVVLYDFSRKPLEHRLLKKDEVIIPGESISFNAHLVDIGEPEGNHQSPLNLNENGTVGKTGIRHGQYDCLWNNVSFAKGKPQNKAYSGKVADMNVLSDFDETKPTNTALPNMLLRNAKQILSMLQKPVAQGINFTGGQTLRSMRHHGSAENLEDGEPIEIMDIKKSPDVLSSKAICSSGMQLPENTEIGRSHQQNTDMEAERTSIGACSSTDPINDGGKGAEELTYSMNMDECPSFDLGF